MTSASEQDDPCKRPESISVTSVERMAAMTDAIVVSAYDGEGFVIWRPTSP
jgi:hypothetical protein